MPLQILIADDDILTRDVMAHVLLQRGHAVTLAADGLQALEGLRREHYDLAILDYHMPLIDGATAARHACEAAARQGRTRFIGVTADPDGLELRDSGGQIFDAIVQKPLSLPVFVEVVEACLAGLRGAEAERNILALWRAAGFERRPRIRLVGQDVEDWTMPLGDYFDLSRPANPDLVLLGEGVTLLELATLRTDESLFALPMVDTAGRWGRLADAAFDAEDPAGWGEASAAAKTFASRRSLLTNRFLSATRLSEQLLAYIFVSGRDLSPIGPETDEWTSVYPGFFPLRRIRHVAERLAHEGWLVRSKGEAGDVALGLPRFSLTPAALAQLTGNDLSDAFPPPVRLRG